MTTLGKRRTRKLRRIKEKLYNVFDCNQLKQRCNASIRELLHELPDIRGPFSQQHAFKDNGSKILAVAHLDTVQSSHSFSIADDVSGESIIFSPRLDDRLGVYTILDILPRFDIVVDILFSENEEIGATTAKDFKESKQYNWIVEFDRSGDDVVTYDYNWKEDIENFFTIGAGTWSDISSLEFLGCKGMNVGVGYYNEHGPRAYFWVEEYIDQIARWILFYRNFHDKYYPHKYTEQAKWLAKQGHNVYENYIDGCDYESIGYCGECMDTRTLLQVQQVGDRLCCLMCGGALYEFSDYPTTVSKKDGNK